MTPHKILDLHFNATREEVTAAYRREAKKCHPDLHPNDPNAAARFTRITEAYNTIIDLLEKPSPRERRPSRQDDHPHPTYVTVSRHVFLSVGEAINGCNKSIEGISGPCENCKGKGKTPTKHPVECTACYGRGHIHSKKSGFINLTVECGDCQGTGKVNWFICHECGGFGTQYMDSCDINIPPGSRHGDKLVVPGGANNKKENVVGDVEITVVIRDRNFRIVDNDVEAIVPLDIWDATLGCEVTVPLPVQGSCKLTVPAETSGGSRFRIKGKGLHYTEEKGDLIAIIRINPLKLSAPGVKEAMTLLRNGG